MTVRTQIPVVMCIVVALVLGACNARPGTTAPTGASTAPPSPTLGGTSPSPSTSPTSTPTASDPPGGSEPPAALVVASEAQAAALVFASEAIFGSIKQREGDVVGQSMDYSTSTTGDGYGVVITMGSGDCPSGCINKHTWTYSVSHDGRVKLVSEQGDEVEATIDPGTADPAQITVRLVAGPVCPVERNPPDPACAPRPVPDAEVVLRDPSGAEIGRAAADSNGMVTFTAPGGAYYVKSAAVEGLMGQAAAEAFSVPGGRSITITLDYDTGIR